MSDEHFMMREGLGPEFNIDDGWLAAFEQF